MRDPVRCYFWRNDAFMNSFVFLLTFIHWFSWLFLRVLSSNENKSCQNEPKFWNPKPRKFWKCQLSISYGILKYARIPQNHEPSFTYSWSKSHIWEHEFFCLGRLGSLGKISSICYFKGVFHVFIGKKIFLSFFYNAASALKSWWT